jgi:hypothetical protein
MKASINNLNNMRTYLVGAMDRVADGGVRWREKITPLLNKMNVFVLDPCKKPIDIKENTDTRKIINSYKETGQYDRIRKEFGYIRNSDLRCVDISDFIICHIDMTVHMCGSYEEIVTANRQKKPILVWCEQGKEKAPNWLFFMIPHEHIFSTMDEMLNYLQDINLSTDKHKLKRWFFLQEFKNDQYNRTN